MIFEARGGDGPNMLRMPPADREAEHALVGCCLMDNTVIDDVVMHLTWEDFYEARCGDAFRGIVAMRDRGLAADAVTLHGEMVRQKVRWVSENNLPRDDYGDFVEQCVTLVGYPGRAVQYAAIVRDKADKRRLIAAAESILRDGYADSEPATALAERAESAIYAVTDARSASTTTPMMAAIDEALARLDRRLKGEFTGITTGFLGLDDLLDGLHDGGMYLIAARPSIGKSAFALNIAEHAVAEHGKPVLYVSLEMRRADLAERFLASRGRIDGRTIRTGAGLTGDDLGRIHELRAESEGFTFEIDDHPSRTISQIAATARRMKARTGLGLLVIDYVGLLDAQPERGESRQETVSRLSRRIKVLAGELEVPILALCQLNRQPEGRADKRPQLADLRETGAWEQDANAVILLHRPEFYDPDERPGEADVMLVKHREGPTGTVCVRYAGCFVRFDDERMQRYDDYGNEI